MENSKVLESNDDTLNFEVEITGMLADGPKPIFDDEAKRSLIGGFVIKAGDTVTASVSTKDNPYTLHFTSGIPFYFTAMEGKDGKISHALISEVPIKPYSVKVQTKPL